jgi:leader peptidase (prepilin peptidase)/N-methyltransferase
LGEGSLLLADFPPTFLRVVAVLFGLIWGSFLNVVIHRLPRGMSLSRPPSHCPHCKTPIKPWRNIPVLSWVLLRGRAPCCGAKIHPRYVVVELLGGILSLAVLEALILPMDPATLAYHALAVYVAHAAIGFALLAAAFIDLEHMLVPDSISFGGTLLGLGTFALRDMSFLDAALGALVGFVIVWLPLVVGYEKLRGKPGMGMGDAKLVMLAGAWLGWPGALLVIGAGAIQGTFAALVLLLVGKAGDEPEEVTKWREETLAAIEEIEDEEERQQALEEFERDPLAGEADEGWRNIRLAFGPFLILATLEVMLLGPDTVISWIVVS